MPVKHYFFNAQTNEIVCNEYKLAEEPLDYKSIAFFAATGFFFGDSSYYKNIKMLPNASEITINPQTNKIESINQYWDWYHKPEIFDVNTAVQQMGECLETMLATKTKGKMVLLPLSGGMDSRTIAAAYPNGQTNTLSYSYNFENGIDEVRFSRRIAKIMHLPFREFTIPKGYLWPKFESLLEATGGYNEVSHSRQMGVIDDLEPLGNLFIMGQGGESYRIDELPDNATHEQLVEHAIKYCEKAGGMILGEQLWKLWGLEGNLKEYIWETFSQAMKTLDIKSPAFRFFAFDYKFCATRRSLVNLNIFARRNEVLLPFVEQEMLDVLCKTDHKLLYKRQVMIEYIKQKAPEIAKVPWQDYYPLNLYNYQNFKKKYRLPERTVRYVLRKFKENVLGKNLIKRNWENQFLGESNDKQLQHFLIGNKENELAIPLSLRKGYYDAFMKENKANAYAISTLLALNHFKRSGWLKPLQMKDIKVSHAH